MTNETRIQCEAKLTRIMAKWDGLPVARQISKLDILALKAMPSSPWQLVIQETRTSLK